MLSILKQTIQTTPQNHLPAIDLFLNAASEHATHLLAMRIDITYDTNETKKRKLT